MCEHLKYATISSTIFCSNQQHATDDADGALVVNNAEYYFSEELKGNIRYPFKSADADVTWFEETDIPVIVE